MFRPLLPRRRRLSRGVVEPLVVCTSEMRASARLRLVGVRAEGVAAMRGRVAERAVVAALVAVNLVAELRRRVRADARPDALVLEEERAERDAHIAELAPVLAPASRGEERGSAGVVSAVRRWRRARGASRGASRGNSVNLAVTAAMERSGGHRAELTNCCAQSSSLCRPPRPSRRPRRRGRSHCRRRPQCPPCT